jgi:phage terminase large subunit-like protein
MYQLPIFPKYQKKFKSEDINDNLIVPNNWLEFARTTKIRSAGNVVYFNPFQYQIDLVNIMLERSVCICKSRQLGISETITSFMLWRACLNPGYLGLVFSKTQTDSSLLARRMKRMIASLGLKTTTENLSDIEIQGRGRILFRNSKPDSARGVESVVDVLLDELAFLETAQEVYNSLAPAQQMLEDKARVFAVSTPNGRDGFYWNLLSSGNGDKDIELLCNQISKDNVNPFQYWVDSGNWAKILIHWKAHPIYGGNPNFLQEIHEKQKLSWATIHQEYNLSFQESESNYFSADIIRLNATGSLEKPSDDDYYFLGIDAATTGEDYAVGTIIKDCQDGTFSVVNIYRKRQESTQYHLYHLGKILDEYKVSLVAVETTGGTGQVWLETLSKTYSWAKFQSVKTTQDSKVVMLDRFKLLLEEGKIKFPQNSPLVDELLSFKRVGKKLQAAQGKHDDIIMAVSFALVAAEEFGCL